MSEKDENDRRNIIRKMPIDLAHKDKTRDKMSLNLLVDL